jgi:GR25 family glycosyltransferase involved in LPS biosynthesis
MQTVLQDDCFKSIYTERFPAVDGKKDNIDDILDVEEKQLTAGEYGCILSHLEVIRKFANTNYDVALVLEDDVTLDFKKYWNKSVQEIMDNAPKDWEIIMLCYHSQKPAEKEYTRNNNDYWSTAAYIIKRETAKKIVADMYVEKSGKYKFDGDTKHAADVYLYMKQITYVYKYPIFMYGYNENNTISTSNVDFHDNSRKQLEEMMDKEVLLVEGFSGTASSSPFSNKKWYWYNLFPHLTLQQIALYFVLFVFVLIFVFFSRQFSDFLKPLYKKIKKTTGQIYRRTTTTK